MLGSLRRTDSWRSGCRKVLVWPERREHDAGHSNTFFASWEIRLCFTIQVFFSFRCFFKESGLASLQYQDRKLVCDRLVRGFVSSVVAGEDSWSPPGLFFEPLRSCLRGGGGPNVSKFVPNQSSRGIWGCAQTVSFVVGPPCAQILFDETVFGGCSSNVDNESVDLDF